MTVASPATPPPGLSQRSARTTGWPVTARALRDGLLGLVMRRDAAAGPAQDLATQLLGERRGFVRRAVGDDQHLGADVVDVGRLEAVGDGDR